MDNFCPTCRADLPPGKKIEEEPKQNIEEIIEKINLLMLQTFDVNEQRYLTDVKKLKDLFRQKLQEVEKDTREKVIEEINETYFSLFREKQQTLSKNQLKLASEFSHLFRKTLNILLNNKK